MKELCKVGIEYGLPLDAFWNMTLDEVMLYLDARREREEIDLKTKLLYDYSLARNIASFVGYTLNGKQIPEFEKIYPDIAADLTPKQSIEKDDWQRFKAEMTKFAITRNELLKRGK